MKEIKIWKGIIICVNENGYFIATKKDDNGLYTEQSEYKKTPTLDEMIKQINKIKKMRIPIYYLAYEEVHDAHITSYNPDKKEGWLSFDEGGHRKFSKFNFDNIIKKDNEKNEELIEEYRELLKEEKTINQRKKEIKSELENITPDDFE